MVSSDGWSPLALAVDQGHAGVLDLLLDVSEEEQRDPKPLAGAWVLQTWLSRHGQSQFGHAETHRRVHLTALELSDFRWCLAPWCPGAGCLSGAGRHHTEATGGGRAGRDAGGRQGGSGRGGGGFGTALGAGRKAGRRSELVA